MGWFVSDDGDTLKIASTLDLDNFSEETKDEAKPIPYGITAFPKGCVTEVKLFKDTSLGDCTDAIVVSLVIQSFEYNDSSPPLILGILTPSFSILRVREASYRKTEYLLSIWSCLFCVIV